MKLMYDAKENAINITVRGLVDFLYRGDIDLRYGSEFITAEEGRRTHKSTEDDTSDNYIAEVPLSCVIEYGGIKYRLSGCADGIERGNEHTYDTVEEIKTVVRPFFGGAERIPPAHVAQGVIYAYMWCLQSGGESAAVRITYAPKSGGRPRKFVCLFSFSELEARTRGAVALYARLAQYYIAREKSLPSEIKSLRFPYGTIREGQKDFMAAVMRAARLKRRVLIQAPTGTGKTMASLYPAVKAIGAGLVDRIFFMTAKTPARLAAEEASAALLSKTPYLSGITITARERICPHGGFGTSGFFGVRCNPDACQFAKGHYDRAHAALFELIAKTGARCHLTAAVITECAARHKVCPYELSLDASEMCDIIVCDYNYVFDPRVYMRRHFDKTEENAALRYIFLCDEAHNLPDRAREMYSALLSLADAETLVSALPADADVARGAAVSLVNSLRALVPLCGDNVTLDSEGYKRGYYISPEPIQELSLAVREAHITAEAYLRRSWRSEGGDPARILAALEPIARYVSILRCYDRRHTTFVELLGDDVTCRLICLDASAHLNERFSRAAATVLFSATLEPPDYFLRVLGCDGADTLELPSPYDPKNLCIVAADKISTRLPDREASAESIAEMIYAVARAKTGNYIVYTPSYKYLTTLLETFNYRYPDIETFSQSRRMTEVQKESFLANFSPTPTRTKVGFCVLGGIFSEGVDLPGDRLSGVVIVGVGLQQITAEGNLLRDYYEGLCERGHEFAYMFPGMNNVLQAAGRVIRSEHDIGVILLIDDRFSQPEYKALFPSHWRNLRYVGDTRALRLILRDFWAGVKDD